jgi:hypothetical protein
MVTMIMIHGGGDGDIISTKLFYNEMLHFIYIICRSPIVDTLQTIIGNPGKYLYKGQSSIVGRFPVKYPRPAVKYS